MRKCLLLFFLLIGGIAFGQIKLELTLTNPSCIKSYDSVFAPISTGSITAAATGGISPYIFTLLGGPKDTQVQNNGYFPNLSADIYKLVVTDATGAEADSVFTLKFVVPGPTVSFVMDTPSSCTSRDGALIVFVSGGTAPYIFSDDGGVSFTANSSFANLVQGTYSLLVQDANGCQSEIITNSVFYSKNCDVYIGTTAFATCDKNGHSVAQAYLKSPPPDYKEGWLYSYDSISFHPPDDPVDRIDTLSNLTPGIHYVYVKDTISGEIATAAIAVAKSCHIYISFVGVDASCGQSDGSLVINASNGATPYTYTMDGISYQASNMFTGLASGSYSVGVKGANGQTNSATATVYNKCPTVTATAVSGTCGQGNGSITATGQKGTLPYLFSVDGNNFQPGNVFSNLAPGAYTVTIKDAKGFTSTAAVMVNNNCIQISISVLGTTCSKNNGTIIATATGGSPPYQFSLDGANFQPGSEFDGLIANGYAITVKDATGLISVKDTVIADSPSPQIGLMTTEASCSNTNGSLIIVRKGGAPPFQYSINNGGTWQTDSIVNGLDSGQYIALAKDANGCTASASVYITALNTPTVSLGNDTTLCQGSTFILSVPLQTGYSYKWQDNSNGNTYTVTAAGIYSLTLTNQYGCSASSLVEIRYNPLPVFALGGDTTLCSGQALLLKPVAPAQGEYLWSTGSASPSVEIGSPGIYWLQLSQAGCAKTDSIQISYKPSPIISLGPDTTLCEGQTLLLSASNDNSDYLWQDGSTGPTYDVSITGEYTVKVSEDGCDTSAGITVSYVTKPPISFWGDTALCATQQLLLDASYRQSAYEWQDGSALPRYTVTKQGTYSVKVTNACGTTTDSIAVAFEDCECKFYVPSAFTPNNDGRNDQFLPKYQCLFSDYEMEIYNRWGQLIFVSRNASVGWDGSFNSRLQPTGTYIWQIGYKDSLTGRNMRKNGTVVLVR